MFFIHVQNIKKAHRYIFSNCFVYLCTMIFYFSGTGNTKWAAERIAARTGERLVSIADEPKGECSYTLADSERIGFCFPVHGWQPPAIVRRFIRRLNITNGRGHYCFILCTCGDTVGDAVRIFNKELERCGLHATAAFSLVMPESYVCLPFMYTDTKEREQEKISVAKEQLETFIEEIANRTESIEHLKKGPTPRLYSYVIGSFFNSRMITDRPFQVEDSCIKCGLCANVCPTDNIVIGEDGRPQWRHDGDCTCCLACYHHCPRHAINYGKITKQRGQYYFKEEKL